MTDRSSLSPTEVVRLATDAFNAGVDDLSFIAPDAVDHSAIDGTLPGSPEHIEAWARRRRAFREAASGVSVTVERVVAATDSVARVLVTRGTINGERFESIGIDMVRVRDGQIVEHWAVAAPIEATPPPA